MVESSTWDSDYEAVWRKSLRKMVTGKPGDDGGKPKPATLWRMFLVEFFAASAANTSLLNLPDSLCDCVIDRRQPSKTIIMGLKFTLRMIRAQWVERSI